MKTRNTIERDLNRIRLKIHEETKDLTPKQYVDYFKKSAEAAMQGIGYKMVPVPGRNYSRLEKINETATA